MQQPSTTLSPEDRNKGYNFVDTTRRNVSGDFERMKLKGDQARATLPEFGDWQKSNPESTVLNRYRNQHTLDQNLGYRMGSGARNWASGDNLMRRGFSGGALPGGILGGVLGVGAGGLLGMVGQHKNENLSPGKLAVLLGILGAGYGTYRGMVNKQASAGRREDPQHEIIQKLQSAPGLSFSERSQLIQGVKDLDPQQAERLSRMVGGAFGASIAAIVAKFLLGAGVGGTALAALAGGLAGRSMLGGPPRNALGQESLNHHTVFGSPL